MLGRLMIFADDMVDSAQYGGGCQICSQYIYAETDPTFLDPGPNCFKSITIEANGVTVGGVDILGA